jgi:hypothetical protein
MNSKGVHVRIEIETRKIEISSVAGWHHFCWTWICYFVGFTNPKDFLTGCVNQCPRHQFNFIRAMNSKGVHVRIEIETR